MCVTTAWLLKQINTAAPSFFCYLNFGSVPSSLIPFFSSPLFTLYYMELTLSSFQHQQVQNNFIINHSDDIKAPPLETDSSITIRNSKKKLVFIDLKKPLDHVYRPGEELNGESSKR